METCANLDLQARTDGGTAVLSDERGVPETDGILVCRGCGGPECEYIWYPHFKKKRQ